MEGAVVYVDVALTEDLEAEGYAREVVRRLQEMRRQLDLAVEDFIAATVEIEDARIRDLLSSERWRNEIMEEVRAVRLTLGEEGAGTYQLASEWDVEGVPMRMGISRAGEE